MRWTETQLAEYQSRRSGRATSTGDAGNTPLRRSRRQTQRELALGDNVRRKRPDLGPKEHVIHIAVAEHLRRRAPVSVLWWHTPNGEHRDSRTAQKLKAMGVAAGLPDLALLIAGRLHWLELKRERGGSLTGPQKLMQQRLRASGCVVATARGLDEALSVLVSWGAFGALGTDNAQPMEIPIIAGSQGAIDDERN